MFASSRHLQLEHLCTYGTPVKKNLGHLPAFPIFISYIEPDLQGDDRDNLFAALEHRNRVRVVGLTVHHSLLEELATVMQEPFPALTHLWFQSKPHVTMPVLPDTFLGGSAPRLQKIYISGIPFPAAPTLLLSAHDLVHVGLHNIPPIGYIHPEAMVASLAALPRLKQLTLGFESGMSYPDRMRLPPITRTLLPSLTGFCFDGLFEYFEDLVAQIDAPQLDDLEIKYLDQDPVTDFQIPQLCKFIDHSEKLKLSRFWHALLVLRPHTAVIDLFQQGGPSFRLSIQEDAIGQVISQISAMLSIVDHLSIKLGFVEGNDEPVGDGIRWLELFRPFTAVKSLSVDDELSWHVLLALKNVTGVRAVEVLPALELLCLENQPVASALKKFVDARQNMGHPVTVNNKQEEFYERLNTLYVSE